MRFSNNILKIWLDNWDNNTTAKGKIDAIPIISKNAKINIKTRSKLACLRSAINNKKIIFKYLHLF